MSSEMTIGQLACQARVNVETVRYYERRGLLDKPCKPLRGYRRYPAETLTRLHFIKRAQELGFTLREIADLLRLGDGSCRETRTLAEKKHADIETRIDDLQAMRATLRALITACRRGRNSGCPLIETLARDA